MPLILGTNSIKDTGYTVANSCMFDAASSAYITRTFGSAGNRQKWTFSTWCKRCKFGAQQTLFGTSSGSSAYHLFYWGSDDTLVHNFNGTVTNASTGTGSLFRDPSAWYHVVCAVDTTQGTAANRVKLYVNGVSVGSGSYPDEDAEMTLNNNVRCDVGSSGAHFTSHMFGGYLAETVFIDGTQYAASDFGEFDEDSPTIWKPKDVSGLTFGTNGFWFDYEDSGTLGNDANGGTDWTATNLAATDQMTDTPTNNFATLNPLDNFYAGATFSEGNLTMATPTTAYAYVRSTLGMASGLWYAECKITTAPADDHANGVAFGPATAATHAVGVNDFGYGYRGDGSYQKNNNTASYGSAISAGDILGIYLDLNANKVYFAINGTLQNSGTGITVVDTTHVPEGELTTGFYHFACSDHATGGTYQFDWNFGAGTSYAVSSGNADANGYGNFEYDPSAGTFNGASKNFYALCTKNLAEFG